MTAGSVVPRWGRPVRPALRSPTRGFSLVEALVAVALFGIVATILIRTLVGAQRTHRSQVQDVALSETARAAMAILPGEFRELSAGDGDISAMDSSRMTYKAMRAVYVLCAPPDTAARSVLLDGARIYGSTPIDVPDDSVLVFAQGDPTTRLDDGWVAAAGSSAVTGSVCPGAAPSLAVTLNGVTAAELSGVRAGAPLRTFRAAQMLAYEDVNRDWWLGQRVFQASSGTWSTVQPVLGPLAGAGLVLTFLDAAGNPADSAGAVARIGIRVRGRSPRRVHRSSGATYLTRDAATLVLLRNNPRY